MPQKSLEIIVKPRGGSGQNARWQWEVCEKGGGLPLRKGTTTGTDRKAYSDANHAMAQLLEKQKTKSK